MLGQARQQRIYRDYIMAMVEGLGSIPYDMVMSSNGFAPARSIPPLCSQCRSSFSTSSR